MTTGVVWSSLRSSRTSEYLDKPVPTTTIGAWSDRKSTRLNSSHVRISYAVFCLKKKNMPSAPQHLLTARHDLPLALTLPPPLRAVGAGPGRLRLCRGLLQAGAIVALILLDHLLL